MPSALPVAPPQDRPDFLGSTYIPVDDPIYPMALRLYSLGYLDSAFISMRPWTRRSLLHMLDESSASIVADDRSEATALLARLQALLAEEAPGPKLERGAVFGVESVYTRLMGIGGPTLRDSYHLGQTLNNDYGRPYQPGFNNVTGFSSVNEWNRFSLYVRGEFQHAPSGPGYSQATGEAASEGDGIPFPPGVNPQPDTLPIGTIQSQDRFRLLEANLSVHLLGHEISGGKSDAWFGPGYGGAMAWSNNAENIYSFRINRVEPLSLPLISRLLGPVRYDFFVGALHGHTVPRDPWVHAETFAFRPTANFEFGFERTVIWGGKGHTPITLHTFLKSFFDFQDTTEDEKFSRDDPGARFSDFNFSWRLPFVRRYATLYLDSIAHDDVTPISAPRRAAYRTGLYLTQLPFLPRLDIRAEGVTTDPGVARSFRGQFNYFETVQQQGYTNNGFITGDWIGREAKGGQAWLTYHLSPDEWVQFEYLRKKNAKDFTALGTTQNQLAVSVLKRLHKDFEVNARVQYERWKAPIYRPGANNDTTISVQLRYFPRLRTLPVAARP